MNLPSGKLMALVAVFAAIGVITGTGAFTTVQAERTATVGVAGDSSALLGLTSAGDSGIAVNNGGQLELQMSSIGNGAASGLNLRALTEIKSVFKITNNGADEVAVNITGLSDDDSNEPGDSGSEANAVALVVLEGQLKTDSQPNSMPTGLTFGSTTAYDISEPTSDGGHVVDLDSGESVKVSMIVDTRDGNAHNDDDTGGSAITNQNEDLLDSMQINAQAGAVDSDDGSETGNLDGTSP